MTTDTHHLMASSESIAATAQQQCKSERDIVLRHVLLFHRHGDRTPILTSIGEKHEQSDDEQAFWTSRLATEEQLARLNQVGKVVGRDPSIPPYAEPSAGALQWPGGQLTQKGIQDMRAKGKALRERYGHVVPTHDHENLHKHVYVLSTNIRRTIQSVQCLLHGMFHDDDQDDDNNAQDATEATSSKKPVFHIHTYERNILAPFHPLRVFGEIELIVADDLPLRSDDERQQIDALGAHLRQVLGIPANQPIPWTAIRDMLTCRKAHDVPFPEGITMAMFEQIHAYDAWLWHRLYSRKDFNVSAFKDGVHEVYQHLKKVVCGTDAAATVVHESSSATHPPKLSFFSAHDNSIVALVNALQLQVGHALPEYGSIVAFEMYEYVATKEHFVKVLFDDQEVPFKGHEHDTLCPFAHFEALALEFLGLSEDQAVKANL